MQAATVLLALGVEESEREGAGGFEDTCLFVRASAPAARLPPGGRSCSILQ